MSRFYTSTGDEGMTGILGGERVKKNDLRMETLGTLDELSAVLGIARNKCKKNSSEEIKRIQTKLYEMMSEIAATRENQPRYEN